ncbi:endonuclease domain-containing 1 protein-like [Esox lucius]|uniref:Endonuclease domain-containing 1 protein-like n=1 Tax=Esox lucius TaxID=8010 RepID=A0AAY5L407_ESOLU|nr:endonuclease domain-containing 1 protein-like [Esox lucius]
MEVVKLLSALLLVSFLPPGFSRVVNKFSDIPECESFFMDKMTPNIPGILVDGIVKDQNRYKPICQMFKNVYRFATIYDTTSRIPVFSAYTFTGSAGSIKRPAWKIEPQLDKQEGEPNMELAIPGVIYNNQAVKEDYVGSEVTKKVNRGHMFPNEFAIDQDTKNSTFTMTNCVPQAETSNAFSWCRMESKVKKIIEDNCKDPNKKAYLVTGAVPGDDILNNRVNIPSYLWSAYCCYNSNQQQWMAKGYWSKNEQEVCGKKRLLPKTLKDLYKDLEPFYPSAEVKVSLFSQQCPVDFTLKVAGEDEEDEDFYETEVSGEDEECPCPPQSPFMTWAWVKSQISKVIEEVYLNFIKIFL